LIASFRRPAVWVFGILLASYAFFWHSRDWNTASRLMLTYTLVDQGKVAISDFHQQTKDKARFRGEYYSDKLPGFSLLATLPYIAAKSILRLPPHPLNKPAFPYWAADYWITLGTSGLLTACTGVLLVFWAGELGCSRRQAALIGLAYGLATPAYVYATLAYGHQASAFALFASFYLLSRQTRPTETLRVLTAGFLAAFAAVIELQVGPAAAILGLYLLAQCLSGRRRPDALAYFAVGALIPTLILLIYNQLAFGSPWDMGYFHHATREFAQVHNRENPLGLRRPDWTKLIPLLWGRYRGLLFYAPILALSLPGWAVFMARRAWDLAVVSLAVAAAILLVNLCYPEWTGGWSTGPRLLVPLLPFAILPVAAVVAGSSVPARLASPIAAGLFLAGGTVMLLFQSVGARVPHTYEDPLVQTVWPMWSGQNPLHGWQFGERFCRNLLSLAAEPTIVKLPPSWQWSQFLPLLIVQGLAIALLWWDLRPARGKAAVVASTLDLPGSSNLGIDQEQDARRRDQEPQDPEAQSQRVQPDSRPGLVTRRGIDQADCDDQRQDQPVNVGRAEHYAEPSAFRLPFAASALDRDVSPTSSSSDSRKAGPS